MDEILSVYKSLYGEPISESPSQSHSFETLHREAFVTGWRCALERRADNPCPDCGDTGYVRAECPGHYESCSNCEVK